MAIDQPEQPVLGPPPNPATAERVRNLFGQVDKTYYATTGRSKSSPLNIFKPSTDTTSTSTSASVQQRDKLEAQQVLRFGVGAFAGLVVEGSRPEFRSTFRAEPSKAQPLAPFQQASAAEVQARFAAIKATARAIVGEASDPIPEAADFAIAKMVLATIPPVSPTIGPEDDPTQW